MGHARLDHRESRGIHSESSTPVDSGISSDFNWDSTQWKDSIGAESTPLGSAAQSARFTSHSTI